MENFTVEIDFKGKASYLIEAYSDDDADERMRDKIENERVNLLKDGEITNWEINSIEGE